MYPGHLIHVISFDKGSLSFRCNLILTLMVIRRITNNHNHILDVPNVTTVIISYVMIWKKHGIIVLVYPQKIV